MAAAALAISLSLDPQHHYNKTAVAFPIIATKFSLHKSNHCHFNHFLSSSHLSSSPATATTSSSFLDDSLRTRRFLTNEELERLNTLGNFVHFHELQSGFSWVRVMRPDEMDRTVSLLAESFAESMLLPLGYDKLLRFLVKQYLIERAAVMPHAVTLLGFYRGKGEGESGEDIELAGTVEVSFDKRGANASPPTPTPPNNSPYICNMTVKKELRRRGIGWHLLKASEELISQMSSSKEVYLHCRMIDAAPFNMYTKSGYSVVKTDNLLILLMLQRRKHLMCKKLPIVDHLSESNLSSSDDELTS